jgi:hypothetical protein
MLFERKRAMAEECERFSASSRRGFLTDLWSRAAARSYTAAELAAGIARIIPCDGTPGGGLSVLRVEAE